MSLLSDLNNKIKALSTRVGAEVKSLWESVNTAQATATAAQTTANTANSTANSAKTTATAAQTTANNANSTANTAKSTADAIAAIAVKTDATTQTVSGTKNFQGLNRQHPGLTKGTAPSSIQYCAIHWTDSTGGTASDHRLATVEYSVDTNGTAGIIIGPYQFNGNSYSGNLLRLSVDTNGVASSSVSNLTVSGYLAVPGGRIWIA